MITEPGKALLQPESKVRVAPSVYARPFGAELVLLDFSRGEYFGLDAVGARIWRGIEEGKTAATIADDVVREHDVAREVAERDVLSLLSQMVEQGLVVADSHANL